MMRVNNESEEFFKIEVQDQTDYQKRLLCPSSHKVFSVVPSLVIPRIVGGSAWWRSF